MENITGFEIGVVGVLAILLKQHWPAIKSLAIGLFSRAVSDPTITNVGCVAAYQTIRPRLTPETARTVWAEIEPKEVQS